MHEAFNSVFYKVNLILYCNVVACHDQVQKSFLLAQNPHRNQISRPGILNDVAADFFQYIVEIFGLVTRIKRRPFYSTATSIHC